MIESSLMIGGVRVPRIMYGTAWKEERTAALVSTALEAGFRGIDTANQRKHYHEAGVGEGIRASIATGLVHRDDLFLQTKFTYREGQDDRLPYDPAASFAEQVEQSLESSLAHLGASTIESLVLHGPRSRAGLGDGDRETWRAMEALRRSGKVSLLGVSNVTAEQLGAFCEFAREPVSFVQNRCYAQLGWDAAVRHVAAENGVVVQAFSLLTANVRELADPRVGSIARRRNRTIPQIVFRFALQAGMIALTGTTDRRHMSDDLAVFDFELDDGEVDTIAAIGL